MIIELKNILKELKIEQLNKEKEATLDFIIDKKFKDCSLSLSIKCKNCPFYENYDKHDMYSCIHSYFVLKDKEYSLYELAKEFKNYINKNIEYWRNYD